MNDKEKKEWVRLPLKCLTDTDLTLSDAIVLSVILDYIDGESKAMSAERITQKTGLSERQVRDSIKRLVKAEYLTAEKRAGEKSIYTQCEVLPPKRQSQKKNQSKSDYCGKPLDLKKYECFTNDFDESFDVEEYK